MADPSPALPPPTTPAPAAGAPGAAGAAAPVVAAVAAVAAVAGGAGDVVRDSLGLVNNADTTTLMEVARKKGIKLPREQAVVWKSLMLLDPNQENVKEILRRCADNHKPNHVCRIKTEGADGTLE